MIVGVNGGVSWEKKCELCGKKFKTFYNQQKYCADCRKNPCWIKKRFQVLHRDNFTCQRTPQDGAKLQVDHIIAKSNGGPDSIDDLITACFECKFLFNRA